MSQKIPPLPRFSVIFFPNGWEFLVQILNAYYTFLSTLDYKFCIQLSATLKKLCILIATTIICSKGPPSAKTQVGWSHFNMAQLCHSTLRKFYGQFNNITSVLARGSHEMNAVHLMKTYCLPTLTYGCENVVLCVKILNEK